MKVYSAQEIWASVEYGTSELKDLNFVTHIDYLNESVLTSSILNSHLTEIQPVPQSVETKLNDYEKRLSNGENIGPISLDFKEFMEVFEGEEYDHRECGFGKMFLESTWGKLEVICTCSKDEFYVSNEL